MRGYRSSYKPSRRQNSKMIEDCDTQKRRVRTPWLDFEIQNLIMGAYNFGVGKWAIIHSQMSFQKNRTYIDLKDKWRNLIDHRHCARTLAVYRAIASIIHNQQMKNGHIKPDRLLTKNDWQEILQMYYSRIQNDIEVNESSEEMLESSLTSDEPECPTKMEVAHKYVVTSFPIITIMKTIPENFVYQPIQTVQPIIVSHPKLPSIKDLLW